MFHLYWRNFFDILQWMFLQELSYKDLVFMQELSYKDTMEIGHYRFCKINLIFSTYVCFARTLIPIPDRVSQ